MPNNVQAFLSPRLKKFLDTWALPPVLDLSFFIDVLMVICNKYVLVCAYYLFSFQGLRFRSGGNGVLHGDSDVAQSKCIPYIMLLSHIPQVLY